MFDLLTGHTQFWSPISFSWGLAIIIVGITYIFIVRRFTWLGFFDIFAGFFFILVGIISSAPFDTQFWASLSLRFSIPIFFFGITLARTYLKHGWLVICLGIILLIIGFLLASKIAF